MNNFKKMQLKASDIADLKTICTLFGPGREAEKLNVLDRLSGLALTSPSLIRDYHEALLFLSAYPDSPELLKKVNAGLVQIQQAVTSLMAGKSEQKKIALNGSGIATTPLIASFSFEFVKWLHASYPGQVRFHSCDISEWAAGDLLRFGLLPLETDLLEKKDLPLNKWLKLAIGPEEKDTLKWFIERFDAMAVPQEVRDHLFDSMKLFIHFHPTDPCLSHTFGRAPAGPLFFHRDALQRKINTKELFDQPLPRPMKISAADKISFVESARISLCLLFRETDPLTYAETEQTEVFEMGRGIRIALFYMRPDRRLPLDSYIGYVAYKNNIPCAYGGGWVFRNKSKIGVNIYPPFRGGESAFLFAQICRLYCQRFAVNILEAEPYQIGKNNPEGIHSGAFWFYYRMGFRPAQKDLYELAENENQKIAQDKKYRTPPSVLRRLSNSILQLNVENPGTTLETLPIDASGLSRLVTQNITAEFKGNRQYALRKYRDELKKKFDLSVSNKKNAENFTEEVLLPLLCLIVRNNEIRKEDLLKLRAWSKGKAGKTEPEFISATRKLERYFKIFDRAGG